MVAGLVARLNAAGLLFFEIVDELRHDRFFNSKLLLAGMRNTGVDAGEPRLSGKIYKITASTSEGISQENAKKVTKLIREEGPKGVKAQIQGDELRISSKSRDDLQAVQALIKSQDYDFAVQFTNYR